mmetsp:Transcript_31887/g.65706  ORF Transcript_31887/g.65706 Transcript_31887/m.65706 type:complete len:89 (+) Transcript_31887:3-269(+)
MVYSWVYRFTSPATQSEMCFEFAIALYGSPPKILSPHGGDGITFVAPGHPKMCSMSATAWAGPSSFTGLCHKSDASWTSFNASTYSKA